MNVIDSPLAGQVKAVVVNILGIEDRAASIDAATPLLGTLPEMDSLAAVELVAALESQFRIVLEDDDINAEAFETLGTLTALVADRARAA